MGTDRTIVKSQFRSWDGTSLVYRTWKPEVESKKAIILMHRGHEHSGRLSELVTNLGLKDYWAFGYDARGHGESPGLRGHANDFSDLVKDLDHFVDYISKQYGIPVTEMALVSNSVGAVVTAAWVKDYSPSIRAMILAAPAFRIKLYVPFAIPMLRLLDKIKRPVFISSYVKSKMLTHDPLQAKAYDMDPLITRDIAVNILLGLHDTATRLMDDPGAIRVPTLVMSAGSDWVVKVGAQKKFFNGLSSKIKKMFVLPKFYHGVLYEKDKEIPFLLAKNFIETEFAKNLKATPSSELTAYTEREYTNLLKPAPLLKRINFALMRFAMSTLGRLSDGMRIGLNHGFDSGLSLDHVYKNKASGRLLIGKIIDYFFINAIGWRGIRKRRENIKSVLMSAINKAKASGRKVRILDVASGPGRYLLEIARDNPDIEVCLKDNVEANLLQGQKIAQEFGLRNAQFKKHDAFNADDFRRESFRPNMIIVSGLYELFSDNEMVKKSLTGIYESLEPGGTLIYTGQPWHPQIELIAKTLVNREGKPWVMRRRTQGELDLIMSECGFEKTGMQMGPYGIFTVSSAKKPEVQTEKRRAPYTQSTGLSHDGVSSSI